MKLEIGSRFVLIGDSITDCGREFPVGEGNKGGLGNGYVNLVNALLTATYPEYHIRVMNLGTSGQTVLDLAARWDKDVLAFQPDWVSVMIGINDVWRQFDSWLQPEKHVSLQVYAETLEKLIQKTLPTVKGMILLSPYMIQPYRNDPMRARMDQYRNEMQRLAVKYQVIFVDVQAEFDKISQVIHPTGLAWDHIHPGLDGHAVIARALLRAMDYEW
jgi:lysophospholipase L1-like esterase